MQVGQLVLQIEQLVYFYYASICKIAQLIPTQQARDPDLQLAAILALLILSIIDSRLKGLKS